MAAPGREAVCKEPFFLLWLFHLLRPSLSHENIVVNETGQFYPSYTIAHYRLSKKTPFRVNHQIQDEKVLICKSTQAFLFRAGDGGEGTKVHAAASPLGQVRWQALRSGVRLMCSAFTDTFVALWVPGTVNTLFEVEKNEKVLVMVGHWNAWNWVKAWTAG